VSKDLSLKDIEILWGLLWLFHVVRARFLMSSFSMALEGVSSEELTYPTWGKGKLSSKCLGKRIC